MIGNPVTADPRLISHSTAPVSWSKARNRPLTSPPKTSPPPVVTSDIVAARCSWSHSVAPVSAEMARTVPALSLPGASWWR